MDDELAAEVTAVIGRSEMDQVSSELTDLADALNLYVVRLAKDGDGQFTKTEAREMAREWYARYLWRTNESDCDCD